MRRTTVGAITLAAALIPATAVAAAPAHTDRAPDTIALPDGWQPEGITTDRKSLYVGSLADGAIWKADPTTGKGRVLARGRDGRVAVGVDYDRKRELLWVAGGPTAEVRAHDADTGKVLARYDFSGKERFLNDVTVTRYAVLVTDSMNQELAVIPFGRHHHKSGHPGDRLPPERAATLLPLTGDLVYTDGFNLNGIVKVRHQVVAVQSNTGLLFRINPRTGGTRQVDLGDTVLTNGDGLEAKGCNLFVVRNQDNLIAWLKIGHKARSGRQVAELTNDTLDVPATVALARGSLWAANARFTTEPTPETPYWISRVSLHH
jgi:sugar lactone lactonase YvrE